MKSRRLIPLLGGALLIGLLAGILGQRRELAARRTPRVQPSAEATKPPAETPAPAPLTDEETRELLTLRRDVGQLRRQRPNLDQLRRENARLRAALTHAPASGPASSQDGTPVLPTSYILASNAGDRGLATPADTLESFLHAARNRDTNALTRVLTPASVTNMLDRIKYLEQAGSGSIFDDFGWIPGFQIQSLEETPEGNTVAELRIDPRWDEGKAAMNLERINGEWRLSLF